MSAPNIPTTRAGIARLAEDTARRTLEHANAKPLPKRRSARRERHWICDVAAACVGEQGIVVYDRLAVGARYSIARKRIEIDERTIDDDGDFAMAHELGHWAWFELLNLPRLVGELLARGYDAEEVFANAYAEALLGRGPLPSLFAGPKERAA